MQKIVSDGLIWETEVALRERDTIDELRRNAVAAAAILAAVVIGAWLWSLI